MKALSIQQPWAHAILHGDKRVENRTWKAFHRGMTLIHAGKKLDTEACEFLAAPYEKCWNLSEQDLHDAPRGAIVGVCWIIDCITDAEAAAVHGAWAMGPWCFVIDKVHSFAEPIPYKGALGFFDVPHAVVAPALAALAVKINGPESTKPDEVTL